jgi:hypothetical protein
MDAYTFHHFFANFFFYGEWQVYKQKQHCPNLTVRAVCKFAGQKRHGSNFFSIPGTPQTGRRHRAAAQLLSKIPQFEAF